MNYASYGAYLPALVPMWIWISMRMAQKSISFTTDSWSISYDYIVGESFDLSLTGSMFD